MDAIKNKTINIRFKAMVNPDYHLPQAVKNNGLVDGYYYYDTNDNKHYIIDGDNSETHWNILPETLSIQNVDPYMVQNKGNINFTLIDPDDKRWNEYYEQRMKYGFDDSETWSLDSTIARFTLPRLKRFKELNGGYPSYLTEESWIDILQKIIDAFTLYEKNSIPFNKNEEKIIEEGLSLFAKYFRNLWW